MTHIKQLILFLSLITIGGMSAFAQWYIQVLDRETQLPVDLVIIQVDMASMNLNTFDVNKYPPKTTVNFHAADYHNYSTTIDGLLKRPAVYLDYKYEFLEDVTITDSQTPI